MSKQYEKHKLSRWVREDEIGRVTAWLRAFRAALEQLGLPGATIRYGDKRTLQEWIRQDGSLVLERADNIVPLATKTANLVPQVVVHLQVLLPAEAQSFGISQVVLDKLVSTFNAFIDHKPKAHTPAQAQAPAVTIVEFLAHLHAVMQALPNDGKDWELFSIHARETVARIGKVKPNVEQLQFAKSLFEHLIYRQKKLVISYQRFLHSGQVRITQRNGVFDWSDVHIACRLYARAMGIRDFVW
ncbi:hypothetical protein [Comamonas sp. E6]|uniref:hypothetical protein n=1 Tax=Comamonas sp. E6 TaxID=364029 RepID=UPI0006388D00|nr:hypothetical protein [Comamonas sp. E6]GAO73457.1 hypothetical protein CSE6_039_48940 [Comamonas sp. E6]